MKTSPEVDAWFDDYVHPAKDAMLRVREIILDDDRMTETIKWKSPTFHVRGEHGKLQSKDEGPCQLDVPHRGIDPRGPSSARRAGERLPAI